MMALAFLAASLGGGGPVGEPNAPPPAGQTPTALTELSWVQKLDSQVPLDLSFRDEQGRSVRLRDLSADRPIVLVLAYYRCPQLCNLVLTGVFESLRQLPFQAGRDFEMIALSFDARESTDIAAAKRENYVAQYAKPGTEAHWHFLTGDADAITKLADAVGFRFAYDAQHDRFNHASGITILTPDGRVSRYLFGIRYPPRDMRLALTEASAGKVGTVVDELLLFCFHYDATAGKYAFAVMAAVRLGAILTTVIVAAIVFSAWRRSRRAAALPAGTSTL